MKRKLTACVLAAILCVLAVSVTALPASADAPTSGDIWSIYNLRLGTNDMPAYGKVPAHSYTAEGLRIVPDGETEFTVQTEYAYSLTDGFFMEILVEDAALFDANNQLVFHLWDQMGMIVGYTHSGSGYYALVSPGTDNHYVVGMVTQEGKGNQDGDTSVAGAIRVPATATSDGKYVFTISASKGVISVNGKAISKNDEVVDFLRSEGADGKAYVGFTMMSLNQAPLSAVTITRFGANEATATVPDATTPEAPAPDTQPSESTDPDREPTDTQEPPSEENDTTAPQPGQDTESEESRGDSTTDDPAQDPGNDSDSGNEEDGSREPEEGTDGETGDRTEGSSDGDKNVAPDAGDEDDSDDLPGGGITKGTLNFFNSINVFDNCSATLGAGSMTALTVLLSCAAWVFRRKE